MTSGGAATAAGPVCRVCGSLATPAGTARGHFLQRDYALAQCASCGYGFVVDPTTEFAILYDERYYDGRGADPLVDYGFELQAPAQTIRAYEWRGIERVASDLIGTPAGRRWIDFGCGNGGLVRYLRDHAGVDAVGLEDGSIADRARAAGIPVEPTDRVDDHRASADVVTAIEVLEHVVDPVDELRVMRSLLKPGGLLFVTTGNLRPHAADLAGWRYVVPEIHISFFEPRTLAWAMRRAGFRPEHQRLGPGFDSILTYKVLKNLRLRRRSALTDAIPQRLVSLAAERLEHLGEHPIGWAV